MANTSSHQTGPHQTGPHQTGPRVFTIPPGANFLKALALELAARYGLADKPEALAEAIIYVPNPRSERALGFALHQISSNGACLLPDIRALGELEDDPPPPSAEVALADLPPAISPAERIGGLTRLVLAYYDSTGMHLPAASALAAARELARLLDQAALSGEVDWQKIDALVPEANLATHWQQSAQFLKIITQAWPAHLEEATALDPYARRYAAAEALVHHWQAHPPQGPVIIAGSTGATPASRLLMTAALSLPQGLVVLPGLDQASPQPIWDDVAQIPSHPQFTLARTLDTLGLVPDAVPLWPMPDVPKTNSARVRLIHEALAPAGRTADWRARLAELAGSNDTTDFVTRALDGLSLIEAEDEADEALLAALMLRHTLETERDTAALITPDMGLARRVSQWLKHWQIEVSPASGLPLSQSMPGSLILLISQWLQDVSHPVHLLAVLQHSAVWFEDTAVRDLDKYVLRGPRVWHNWDGLLDHAERCKLPPSSQAAVRQLLLDVSTALEMAGIETDAEIPDIDGDIWLNALSALAGEVCAPPAPWLGEAGASTSSKLRELADMFSPLGPQPLAIWRELLEAEFAQTLFQSGPPHARLAIWRPIEARLQTADRIILAGLNEGVWPAQPPADAFLPRRLRTEMGLSDPDERIGLSAHDFAQFAAAPQVTLLTSQRREDKPAIASRWVWRLRTLVRGALGGEGTRRALSPSPGLDPRPWAAALQMPPPLTQQQIEPRPTPPLYARPRELSVTRIETLIRDPYAIYGEYVLGLRKLDRLNVAADVRTRGTAIHAALERFELDGGGDTPEALLHLLEDELRRGGESEAELIGLRGIRAEVCRAYVIWRETVARDFARAPLTEQQGRLQLEIAGQPFTLKGTADLLHAYTAGGAAILDYKTGAPPTDKQVLSGLAPQMPLQGLIAEAGGYSELGQRRIEALTYIQFGSRFKVEDIGQRGKKDEVQSIAEILAAARTGLVALLTEYANPEHPYLSAPRPERVPEHAKNNKGDYDRLARRAEWAGLTNYD